MPNVILAIQDCRQMLWELSEGSNHFRLCYGSLYIGRCLGGRDWKGFKVELEEMKVLLMDQWYEQIKGKGS